ncbi:MAG TPA: dethiobiotin synthase [bacterium]|nr:dethiobiotin synthase [bacterium]
MAGTDTGVGKSLISAGLARLWVNQGHSVGVLKPVASGSAKASPDRSGGLISEDGKLLQKAAKLPNSAYASIVPVHYRQPLAPYVAAWKEGAVPLAKVEKAYREARAKYDRLIVEGIGGVLVPITKDFLAVDWQVKWELPTLVVARAGLGTINHTLLTLEALRRRKVKVLGVVVNGYKGKTIAERTNVRALRKLAGVRVYGPVGSNPKYRTNLDLLARDLERSGLGR